MIVGAQKGGTVPLRRYLPAHPRVIGPQAAREVHFFTQDLLYRQGMTWYSQFFPLPHRLRGGKQTFECTTSYMYYPKAPQRIHRHMPHVKLIVLLREPIGRAFSAWNMFRHFHAAPDQIVPVWPRQFDPSVFEAHMSFISRDPFPDFATAVTEELGGNAGDGEIDLPGLVGRGYYHEQLARIFSIFKRDQVLVLESSQLQSRTREILDQVVDFLGLPRFEWPDHVLVPHNTREYINTIDSKTRSMLTEVFRPHNERLFELLGVDLGWNRTP